MNVEIILNWRYGVPELSGMYFAAVKYGESAGSFEFINWNESSWDIDSGKEVVAFMELHEFKNQLSIQWPAEHKKQSTAGSESGSDPWAEA
ncbi:hypothetical protein ACL7TT_07470 [Microbulbifer sp. 2304DJ12-6]|uniref:hypothetical protein n=1 Tax=Microbulbifer sp. 2304DJ12-6 TaxID=3233340 RepID=UPI0039B0BFDC